jgi:hypothetical protein
MVNLKREKDAEVKDGQAAPSKNLEQNRPIPASESFPKPKSDDPQKCPYGQSAFWANPGIVLCIFEKEADTH